MRSLLIVAVLLLAAGCKESPEAAAQRIRDTMAAMQEQQAADEAKRIAELFARLDDRGDEVENGMSEQDVHSLVGKPVASRTKRDGSKSQAWAATYDGQKRTLTLRIVDGVAVDVDFKR